MRKLITKEDYMKGRATFSEYYLQNAKILCLIPKEDLVEEAIEALKRGDRTLSTVSPQAWNYWAFQLMSHLDPARILRHRGIAESWGFNDMICTLKELVRHEAMRRIQEREGKEG